MNATSTVVLIPAYQPDNRLVTLVEAVRSHDMDVLVVDDGSGSDYETIFEEAGAYANVIHLEKNGGKGNALKVGLDHIWHAYKRRCVIVTADADGQHRIDDIARVRDIALLHPTDLVLGSRLCVREMPLRSRVGNGVTRSVFHAVAGSPVFDTQTGLRAFSRGKIPFMLGVEGSRYEYEMNVLLLWVSEGRTVREIEIKTIYLDGNSSSHFDTLRDSARIYGQIGHHLKTRVGQWLQARGQRMLALSNEETKRGVIAS